MFANEKNTTLKPFDCLACRKRKKVWTIFVVLLAECSKTVLNFRLAENCSLQPSAKKYFQRPFLILEKICNFVKSSSPHNFYEELRISAEGSNYWKSIKPQNNILKILNLKRPQKCIKNLFYFSFFFTFPKKKVTKTQL